MPLINIVIALIIVGVALWLINNFIPMAGSIKTILNIVVVVAVAIWSYRPSECGDRLPVLSCEVSLSGLCRIRPSRRM